MPTITADIAARNGAGLLDRLSPDWHLRIDLGELDLSDLQMCVLGQLHGTFSQGLGWLDQEMGVDLTSEDIARLGFELFPVDGDEDPMDSFLHYEVLTNAWEKEVEWRRELSCSRQP